MDERPELLHQLVVGLELLLWPVPPVALITAGEPDLESDASVELQVVDQPEAGDQLVVLVVAADDPDEQVLPEIVQLLLAELEVGLEVPSLPVERVLPLRLDILLEHEDRVHLLGSLLRRVGFQKAGPLRVEDRGEVVVGGVLPKLHELVQIGESG